MRILVFCAVLSVCSVALAYHPMQQQIVAPQQVYLPPQAIYVTPPQQIVVPQPQAVYVAPPQAIVAQPQYIVTPPQQIVNQKIVVRNRQTLLDRILNRPRPVRQRNVQVQKIIQQSTY